MLDPYTLLGVNPESSDEKIKAAYKLRMSMLHPDKFAAGTSQWAEANRMSAEVNGAYEQIKNPEARRAYAASHRQKTPPRPAQAKPAPPPSRSNWKPAYQERQEQRAREQARLRQMEQELAEYQREQAAMEAARLEKHPWVREWIKAVRPFQKNKMVTIYGAAFLCLGLLMLIRYPSFRGMELLFWFTHAWFQH